MMGFQSSRSRDSGRGPLPSSRRLEEHTVPVAPHQPGTVPRDSLSDGEEEPADKVRSHIQSDRNIDPYTNREPRTYDHKGVSRPIPNLRTTERLVAVDSARAAQSQQKALHSVNSRLLGPGDFTTGDETPRKKSTDEEERWRGLEKTAQKKRTAHKPKDLEGKGSVSPTTGQTKQPSAHRMLSSEPQQLSHSNKMTVKRTSPPPRQGAVKDSAKKDGPLTKLLERRRREEAERAAAARKSISFAPPPRKSNSPGASSMSSNTHATVPRKTSLPDIRAGSHGPSAVKRHQSDDCAARPPKQLRVEGRDERSANQSNSSRKVNREQSIDRSANRSTISQDRSKSIYRPTVPPQQPTVPHHQKKPIDKSIAKERPQQPSTSKATVPQPEEGNLPDVKIRGCSEPAKAGPCTALCGNKPVGSVVIVSENEEETDDDDVIHLETIGLERQEKKRSSEEKTKAQGRIIKKEASALPRETQKLKKKKLESFDQKPIVRSEGRKEKEKSGRVQTPVDLVKIEDSDTEESQLRLGNLVDPREAPQRESIAGERADEQASIQQGIQRTDTGSSLPAANNTSTTVTLKREVVGSTPQRGPQKSVNPSTIRSSLSPVQSSAHSSRNVSRMNSPIAPQQRTSPGAPRQSMTTVAAATPTVPSMVHSPPVAPLSSPTPTTVPSISRSSPVAPVSSSATTLPYSSPVVDSMMLRQPTVHAEQWAQPGGVNIEAALRGMMTQVGSKNTKKGAATGGNRCRKCTGHGKNGRAKHADCPFLECPCTTCATLDLANARVTRKLYEKKVKECKLACSRARLESYMEPDGANTDNMAHRALDAALVNAEEKLAQYEQKVQLCLENMKSGTDKLSAVQMEDAAKKLKAMAAIIEEDDEEDCVILEVLCENIAEFFGAQQIAVKQETMFAEEVEAAANRAREAEEAARAAEEERAREAEDARRAIEVARTREAQEAEEALATKVAEIKEHIVGLEKSIGSSMPEYCRVVLQSALVEQKHMLLCLTGSADWDRTAAGTTSGRAVLVVDVGAESSFPTPVQSPVYSGEVEGARRLSEERGRGQQCSSAPIVKTDSLRVGSGLLSSLGDVKPFGRVCSSNSEQSSPLSAVSHPPLASSSSSSSAPLLPRGSLEDVKPFARK